MFSLKLYKQKPFSTGRELTVLGPPRGLDALFQAKEPPWSTLTEGRPGGSPQHSPP